VAAREHVGHHQPDGDGDADDDHGEAEVDTADGVVGQHGTHTTHTDTTWHQHENARQYADERVVAQHARQDAAGHAHAERADHGGGVAEQTAKENERKSQGRRMALGFMGRYSRHRENTKRIQ